MLTSNFMGSIQLIGSYNPFNNFLYAKKLQIINPSIYRVHFKILFLTPEPHQRCGVGDDARRKVMPQLSIINCQLKRISLKRKLFHKLCLQIITSLHHYISSQGDAQKRQNEMNPNLSIPLSALIFVRSIQTLNQTIHRVFHTFQSQITKIQI